MSVGERRNDNLVVQLDPKLQAQPVELLRQRWSPDGHSEYLIRWALQCVEEGAAMSRSSSQARSKAPNIQMWMSAEEVYTNCPTLLGKGKAEGITQQTSSASPDEGALQEMTRDVRMLVTRVSRQMSQSSRADPFILNTIHVLSAYASISSLAGVFKKTGALDLLMKMLCNPEKEIRKNACKMLRALASHDAGSRAHVLLSLSQQDAIEQHMDFESRCALLQLFAETTSSEEYCFSLDGLPLPQIPGKQLFSLVKRYLCVTSLLDQMSGDRPDGSETSRVQRQFDVSMAMGSLVCELVRAMGLAIPEWKHKGPQPNFCREIFPPCPKISHRKHRFKVRSHSSSCRRNSMEYLERALLPGMSVRVREDYERLKAGDEGVVQSIKGHPPVQVHWHRVGHVQPVDGSMLEITKRIIPPLSQADTSAQPCDVIRRDEWWEILFFVTQLEDAAQRKVTEMTGCSSEEGRLPPRLISVSVDLAQEILAFLVENCHGRLLSDLQTSHVYKQFYGKSQSTTSVGDDAPSTDPGMCQGGAGQGADAGPSDLQILNTLLMLEGLELSEKGQEKTGGPSSDHDTEIKRSLESCRVLASGVRHVGLEHDWTSADRNLMQDGAQGAFANSALREKMVGMLVELLTSQVKDKLLVVTCLQLTYQVMSKYDWRVLFATEGGLRAVLACMQKHHSSAAVQHIGLAVLKVLTGVDGSDPRRPPSCNNMNPGDSMIIKEVFFSIGSAASGASGSLISAIPSAIAKMISMEGCVSSAYNGLLVVWMLVDNHKGLSEQLSTTELPCILQRFSEESGRSMTEPQRRLLALLLICCPQMTAPGLAVQEMDVSSLLSALKDARMCQQILPSLDRCVSGDVSSLRCDVPQLLTNPNFFLQLLACLERLKAEKHLQLCVYRILNKALHLYEEDAIPWHKMVAPSLRILEASGGERELFQEVVRFLHSLAVVSKDCTLVMCGLGAEDILSKVLDNQSSDEWTSRLRDLLAACDTYTAIHHKMAAYVVAGCMQTVLSQIDEHRLRHQRLTIPLLDVFLQSLAGACTRAEQKEDKCWLKMEVSSNSHHANKLTDGNPKSYWESSGSAGCHYIIIHMHAGVVMRQLVMVVANEDSSYMPARVVVMGGESPTNIHTELNLVNISSTARRVVLLENVACFWPVIQIKIKRCHQGGIDTRVRGLEILGPKPTFWPVFKEHLCRRTFLLYSCKAHSWGKEIRDKKEKVLHLFSRLSRALSHEQEFADRFLPDAEAARALGRTCSEALILPLVHSITSSDPGGASSFGWLLTRYLEDNSGSRQPKSRLLAFNSQVRRLTHLLVNVDTNPPDTTIAELPNKSDGKNHSSSSVPERASSCMGAMAQCWQEVVQQQVQHFLEVSWNDEDLVPRMCSMFTDLRRAMEEMFGQQAQFLLALQRGFCQAMLQLSLSTTLHVTEQFALYIDQRIIAVYSDSSDVQSMEELRHFLQVIPFLSQPELSNHYEHFYRYYLADRLLTIGRSWLENFVVDHTGVCFPNQFPQQMLKNFQEAKDLQREEHFYRLQQLDVANVSEDEDEGEVMADDDGGKDDGFDVEVCLLSSHCWPFSADLLMDDPQKYFPPEVTQHLLSSTNVIRKCADRPDCSQVGQSRRLRWMWLGKAELQYGGLTLQVSTLQMFILLQFNQQEEISEEEIRERSGVSDGLLRNSLQALTANNGILAIREDSGGFSLNTSAMCDLAGTVLDLHPARVLGVPDIGSLEEKRRLILEEVDRVIKEERHLHINALVAKVIEASRKWKDAALGCAATDVLSCIACRIRGGAIYRKTTNPLIVCCKEDPPPSPPPLSPLLSHNKPVPPVPPQVSEFCRVRKIANNIGAEPEERPKFQTFRYPE